MYDQYPIIGYPIYPFFAADEALKSPTLMEVNAKTGVLLRPCTENNSSQNKTTWVSDRRLPRPSKLRSEQTEHQPEHQTEDRPEREPSVHDCSVAEASEEISCPSGKRKSEDPDDQTPDGTESKIQSSNVKSAGHSKQSTLHLSHSAWTAAATAGNHGFSFSTDDVAMWKESSQNVTAELPLSSVHGGLKKPGNLELSEVEGPNNDHVSFIESMHMDDQSMEDPSLDDQSLSMDNRSMTDGESLQHSTTSAPPIRILSSIRSSANQFVVTTEPFENKASNPPSNGNFPNQYASDENSIWIVQFHPLTQKNSMIRDFLNCEHLLESIFEGVSLNASAFAAR